jgi:hypothetical protein
MSALPALQRAAEVDLDRVPSCPLCLLDLALEIQSGEQPSRGLVSRTVDWVWMESGEAVREAVVRARMEKPAGAEEALRDIELNGWRGRFAEAIVLRLASQLADTCLHAARNEPARDSRLACGAARRLPGGP